VGAKKNRQYQDGKRRGTRKKQFVTVVDLDPDLLVSYWCIMWIAI
jgi:hypothetical protein